MRLLLHPVCFTAILQSLWIAHSFVPQTSLLLSPRINNGASSATIGADDYMADTIEKAKGIVVQLAAEETWTTPSLPLQQQGKLLAFFQDESTGNMLFSKDATLEDLGDQVPAKWTGLLDFSSSRTAAAATDNSIQSTRFVQLTNPPLQFLGVKLTSTATVAVRLVQSGTSLAPELQFTLLSTDFKATGSPPLVWAFYKIMGGKGKSIEATCNPEANQGRLTLSGFTRVYPESENGSGQVLFTNRASLLAQIQIPKMLMKFLPMSVQELETNGSATLQTAIRQDQEPAMRRLEGAWLCATGASSNEAVSSIPLQQGQGTVSNPKSASVNQMESAVTGSLRAEEADKPNQESRLRRIRKRLRPYLPTFLVPRSEGRTF